MGQTCVANRRMPNKRSNDLDVSGEKTKGKPMKMDRQHKRDMECGRPRGGGLASYSV
jgi:hypothetical protein